MKKREWKEQKETPEVEREADCVILNLEGAPRASELKALSRLNGLRVVGFSRSREGYFFDPPRSLDDIARMKNPRKEADVVVRPDTLLELDVDHIVVFEKRIATRIKNKVPIGKVLLAKNDKKERS